jgi:nucleoside-diphosphate-sugar epimerase
MNILVTGGSGFIGRNITKWLLHHDHRVMAPVRYAQSLSVQPDHPNFYPQNGLFYDDSMIENYRKFNPEIILHLAALRGEGRGSVDDYQQVNVLGTKKLVQYARQQRVKLFIYFSTVGVYGTIPSQLPAGLQTRINPDSLYHQSKYQGEILVRGELAEKIPFIIIRPTITYGPKDINGFLYKMIKLVSKTRFPLIRKDIMIHLLDVETLSNFVNISIGNPGLHDKVYILADRSPVKLNDLVDAIYSYFHHRRYPAVLKVPRFCYKIGEKITHYLNLKSYNISFKLLSYSWYYDTRDLEYKFSIPLSDTLTSIKTYLAQGFSDHDYHGKN